MKDRKVIRIALPVLFGFFVMGFCDIVGISSDYAATAFGWSGTMAGVVPSVVFVWFFLLGVPFGLMMNRVGRKNTVLFSMAVTVVGMLVPLAHYDSITTLVAYALLGIGNVMLQVSLNPLLQNVVADEGLLASSLTAGQVVKAVSSFVGPFIVLAAVNWLGGGDEAKWYYCFPLMGAVTLVSGVWLWLTPVAREPLQEGSGLADTFSLLTDKAILLLFLGIFFAVGTDVATNFISSKVMLFRFGYGKEMAAFAPQVYFVCRTIGAFVGMFFMAKMSAVRYFRLNIVAGLVCAVVLAFWKHEAVNFICIGGIGFCCSCVFPIIYAKAIERHPDRSNEISGLMMMGVAGGTVSFLVGVATDWMGVAGGVLVIALELLYLVACSFYLKTR
ncbi:MAG: MFS transporter [Bacteroidaceae bacterium]|nr:MFS transporter [Bacteroidaceae bacterium]